MQGLFDTRFITKPDRSYWGKFLLSYINDILPVLLVIQLRHMISCQFSKSNVHMNLFICTIWEVKCRLHSSFSLNKYTCSLHLQNEFYHHGGCVKVYLFTLNISGHLQAYIHIIFNITYFSHVQCMTFKKIAKNDDVRFFCLIIYQQWYFPGIILKIRISYIVIFHIKDYRWLLWLSALALIMSHDNNSTIAFYKIIVTMSNWTRWSELSQLLIFCNV